MSMLLNRLPYVKQVHSPIACKCMWGDGVEQSYCARCIHTLQTEVTFTNHLRIPRGARVITQIESERTTVQYPRPCSQTNSTLNAKRCESSMKISRLFETVRKRSSPAPLPHIDYAVCLVVLRVFAFELRSSCVGISFEHEAARRGPLERERVPLGSVRVWGRSGTRQLV